MSNDKSMFITWDVNDPKAKARAIQESSKALASSDIVVHKTRGSNRYFNIAPNSVSVRDGFNRRDYEEFRLSESLPITAKEAVADCMDAYKNVGVVHNVIDLMADFATQGITINHPNERIEKWYREWFRKVRGKNRSERFLNIFYRTANVIVQRHTAKIPVKLEREMQRTISAPDMEINPPPNVSWREVPWRYTFKNPLTTELLSEELSLFVGQDAFVYGIKVPKTLATMVKNPKNAHEKSLVKKIPENIRKAIRSGEYLIPLDPEKIRVFHYKRDDWEPWAYPMVTPILGDLQVLQKMKLADLAALDGAVSCIRVWRIGSLEHGIMPTAVAINRLAEMLVNNVGGSVMDLIWGPELDLLETSTDVHHFLGNTKYEPVLTSIYAGLGIPPTLTGAATQGGFTNNFISLKTLTERLQYGRDALKEFWDEELRLVQKAMGFRFPATISFNRMVLSDEAAEKQLLINMADRDIISLETLQERFGEIPEIERIRMKRESRRRKRKQLPPKAGPFHVDKEHEYTKMFVQHGVVSPTEVGVELDEKKPGDKTPVEFQSELAPTPEGGSPKGQPGQGRPRLSKDKKKRKKKEVKPRTSAVFFQTLAWAENAQAKISSMAAPAYLSALNKKTLRELTDEEARKFENYKFAVLCTLTPNQDFDENYLASLTTSQLSIPPSVQQLMDNAKAKYVKSTGKEPGFETIRLFQSGIFAFWKGDFTDLV